MADDLESSWFWNMTELLARDNDALTRALQVSLSDDSSASTPPPESISPAFTPQSGSATRNPLSLKSGGKIGKRKSRASKKSPTTYITADPANFRQMVQQVTGVRFGAEAGMGPVGEALIRPQPQRGVGVVTQSTCLPTLDTSSSFLTDRGRAEGVWGVGSGFEGMDGNNGFGFGVSSFPTLESWGAI